MRAASCAHGCTSRLGMRVSYFLQACRVPTRAGPVAIQRTARGRSMVTQWSRRSVSPGCYLTVLTGLDRDHQMTQLRSPHQSRAIPLPLIVAVLAALQGCITGVVRDATTGAPIEDVTVVIEGKCSG